MKNQLFHYTYANYVRSEWKKQVKPMKNQIKPIFGIKIVIKPAEKQKKTKKTIFEHYGFKMEFNIIVFFVFAKLL